MVIFGEGDGGIVGDEEFGELACGEVVVSGGDVGFGVEELFEVDEPLGGGDLGGVERPVVVGDGQADEALVDEIGFGGGVGFGVPEEAVLPEGVEVGMVQRDWGER